MDRGNFLSSLNHLKFVFTFIKGGSVVGHCFWWGYFKAILKDKVWDITCTFHARPNPILKCILVLKCLQAFRENRQDKTNVTQTNTSCRGVQQQHFRAVYS